MASLNRVFLIGNLTRDPEVRHTPKGTAVGDLGMAINMSYRTADGQTKDEVCYVDVVVWGRAAENCKNYLTKGAPIFVEGRLQLDQWETQDGSRKSKLRVRAERVQFLGRPSNRQGNEGGPQPQKRSTPQHSPHDEGHGGGYEEHVIDENHHEHVDDDIPF
jgi:single-strand DNA-binding protein